MELALSHGGMMKRILSIVRSFALIASVLLASPTYADFLSCTDFDKIIRFVEAEHLRFSAEKNSNLKTLLESAAQKIPEILRYEGAYVMAAQFENYWPAQLQNEKIWFSTQNLCEALFHSRHREALLKAFVSALDPFSEFYSSNELDKKTSVVDGHFVGVGVGTKSEDRYLRVTEVVEGGPSHSILREGDLISHIDDHPVRGLSLFDLRQRIRGPLHSLVEFRVKRDKQILNLKVRRDHVYQKSLTHEWVEENILQIKIHRFYAHTPAQLGNLVRENYSRIKGLILDLRDNPGGLLQAARDIVDLFVSQGVVVHLKGTYEDQMWALGDADFLDVPLVVLINEKTASASEIVAGALQDYGRAVLVGQQTYGKSCVQNIYDTTTALGTEYKGGLKLTTLWFYLPSGRSVQSLTPDIQIAAARNEEAERLQMPFSWPQQIDVIPFPKEEASFSDKIKKWRSHLMGISQSEEIGKALIRQMATTAD